MTIQKTVKKLGKGVVTFFDTTGDMIEITIKLLKNLIEIFPDLGKLLFTMLKTSGVIAKNITSLNYFIGLGVLCIPFMIIMSLAVYIGNVLAKEEHKNKMFDQILFG